MKPTDCMKRALFLAQKARGKTSPNPLVGAVLVKEGKIVGEGFHHQAGLPHAEREALKQAGKNAKDAVLYVNLEPCCHYGKTPPCVEVILQAGVKKIVAAMVDPNPQVNGKGIAALREAGIEVQVGLLEEEARKINEVFLKWIATRIPFIVLKWAMTLDGKIAARNGNSKWISGEESRKRVREMRGWHDAVLVGIGTVLKDDPLLTCRTPDGENPIRIVLDSKLRVPPDSRIVQTVSQAQTWIISAAENPKKQKQLEDAGVSVFSFPDQNGRVDLRKLCKFLGEKEITSLFVEGGSAVHGSFLEAGLADKLAIFIAPKILGDEKGIDPVSGSGKTLQEATRLRDVTACKIEDDLLIEGYVHRDR